MSTPPPLLPNVILATAVGDGRYGKGAIERRLAAWGERLNPILVKETRQAVKSRQFTITFGLLLLLGWCWSMLGPAMFGPEIRYLAKGSEMFLGYYFILAFPLLVIVPYGAFRSLLSEQEERTYELVSISTLRPGQIVSGKLAGAGLQMLIYLSAIMPCLAFTYLLRGIGVPMLVVSVLLTVVLSLNLSVLGLLLATLTAEKHWQTVLSVVMVIGLLFILYIAMILAGSATFFSEPVLDSSEFWQGLGLFLLNNATYFWLVFAAAAARLSFASDNRSTPLRVAMLAAHAMLVATATASWWLPLVARTSIFATLLGLHWYVLGALMTGESPSLSLRVRRRLPQSFLGRACLTWFNPGPATGYVFAVSGLLSVVVLAAAAAWYQPSPPPSGGSTKDWECALSYVIVGASYVTLYLGVGLMVIRLLRRVTQVTLLLAGLVHLVLFLAGTLVPTTIQFSMTSLNRTEYSLLQLSNPVWSLSYVARHGLQVVDATEVIIIVPLAALIVFCLNLPAIAREMQQLRIAPPPRVTEDDAVLTAPEVLSRQAPGTRGPGEG